MAYRIFGRKHKSKFHIIDPETGKTYCKAENNLQIHFRRDFDKAPTHRPPCSICVQRSAGGRVSEPSLAVLMGEAIEVEPCSMEATSKAQVRDAGKFLTIERDGRAWTLGKECPWFEEARRELTGL